MSLAVRLTLWIDGKKKVSFEDGFLFTHFGFSGPSALDMSRHWIHWKNAGAGASLTANFLPLETETGFREKLEEAVLKSPRLTVKNFLARRLPGRFTGTVLTKIKIPAALALNQLTRGAREALIRSLFHFPLEITGVYGYKKAEVTAGGVDLAQIDARTLESKIQPGLFFAGEILDADGRIGGFNFQWAWSSGFLAGRGAAKKVLGGLP